MEATRTCSIEGCDREGKKRGWCRTHYQRWLRHGDPGSAERLPPGSKPKGRKCEVLDCDRKHCAKGLCSLHLQRMERNGTVDVLERVARTCSLDGCERAYLARDMCEAHYARWRQKGDPGPVEIPEKPGWTGDEAGYKTVHKRLKRERGLATDYRCEHCGGKAAEWAYDHADPDERTDPNHQGCPYSLNLDRYVPLCATCHRRFDRAHAKGENVTVPA